MSSTIAKGLMAVAAVGALALNTTTQGSNAQHQRPPGLRRARPAAQRDWPRPQGRARRRPEPPGTRPSSR